MKNKQLTERSLRRLVGRKAVLIIEDGPFGEGTITREQDTYALATSNRPLAFYPTERHGYLITMNLDQTRFANAYRF